MMQPITFYLKIQVKYMGGNQMIKPINNDFNLYKNFLLRCYDWKFFKSCSRIVHIPTKL